MLVNKGFRFRAYPDEAQRIALARWFGCTRLVANLAIDQRRMFSRRGRNISYVLQAKELPDLRKEFPWLAECPNQILQSSLRDVDQAYQRFFKGLGEYPRKRGKYDRDSVRFPALEQRPVLKEKPVLATDEQGNVVTDDDGKPVWHRKVVTDEKNEPLWTSHTIIELGEEWIDLPKIGKLRWSVTEISRARRRA